MKTKKKQPNMGKSQKSVIVWHNKKLPLITSKLPSSLKELWQQIPLCNKTFMPKLNVTFCMLFL